MKAPLRRVSMAHEFYGPEVFVEPAQSFIDRAVSRWHVPHVIENVPFVFGRAIARTMGWLRKDPAVTSAMLGVLDHDDDVDQSVATKRLGIELTPLDRTLARLLRD